MIAEQHDEVEYDKLREEADSAERDDAEDNQNQDEI